jgi:hypothetical protein
MKNSYKQQIYDLNINNQNNQNIITMQLNEIAEY